MLATVGRKTAVIAFGRLRLKGWLAWWIWDIAHMYFLIVMTQWLWSYASFERGARLITGLHLLKADHEPAREPAHARRRDDDARPPYGQRAA